MKKSMKRNEREFNVRLLPRLGPSWDNENLRKVNKSFNALLNPKLKLPDSVIVKLIEHAIIPPLHVKSDLLEKWLKKRIEEEEKELCLCPPFVGFRSWRKLEYRKRNFDKKKHILSMVRSELKHLKDRRLKELIDNELRKEIELFHDSMGGNFSHDDLRRFLKGVIPVIQDRPGIILSELERVLMHRRDDFCAAGYIGKQGEPVKYAYLLPYGRAVWHYVFLLKKLKKHQSLLGKKISEIYNLPRPGSYDWMKWEVIDLFSSGEPSALLAEGAKSVVRELGGLPYRDEMRFAEPGTIEGAHRRRRLEDCERIILTNWDWPSLYECVKGEWERVQARLAELRRKDLPRWTFLRDEKLGYPKVRSELIRKGLKETDLLQIEKRFQKVVVKDEDEALGRFDAFKPLWIAAYLKEKHAEIYWDLVREVKAFFDKLTESEQNRVLFQKTSRHLKSLIDSDLLFGCVFYYVIFDRKKLAKRKRRGAPFKKRMKQAISEVGYPLIEVLKRAEVHKPMVEAMSFLNALAGMRVYRENLKGINQLKSDYMRDKKRLGGDSRKGSKIG